MQDCVVEQVAQQHAQQFRIAGHSGISFRCCQQFELHAFFQRGRCKACNRLGCDIPSLQGSNTLLCGMPGRLLSTLASVSNCVIRREARSQPRSAFVERMLALRIRSGHACNCVCA